MEMKELAKQLKVKNILVARYRNSYWKDQMTIIVDDTMIINLVGKTISCIPLTVEKLYKTFELKGMQNMFNTIKRELDKKNIIL